MELMIISPAPSPSASFARPFSKEFENGWSPESKLKKDSYELFAEFSAFTREAKFSLNYDLVNPFNLKREKSALFFDLANDHDDIPILVTATKDPNGFKFSGKSRPDVVIRINDPEENSETE